VAIRLGGAAVAHGERLSVELGVVGLVVSGDAALTQSYARSILAREVRIKQSVAQSVVAGNVVFEKQSGAFIVLARKVEGDVRTVLDWRGALALGAVLAAGIGLLARRKRR
jgi:hypothetical protein